MCDANSLPSTEFQNLVLQAPPSSSHTANHALSLGAGRTMLVGGKAGADINSWPPHVTNVRTVITPISNRGSVATHLAFMSSVIQPYLLRALLNFLNESSWTLSADHLSATSGTRRVVQYQGYLEGRTTELAQSVHHSIRGELARFMDVMHGGASVLRMLRALVAGDGVETCSNKQDLGISSATAPPCLNPQGKK
ncbi:hypothetical protein C8R44DRAFT_744499 [Mycena epipterygia]|nr:hypothetical protein C8R44DRAFT_744499 [Mycena epipterygia]